MKKIVLVGMTGTGKSTLGNALLGLDQSDDQQKLFETSPTAESCTLHTASIDGFWLGMDSLKINNNNINGNVEDRRIRIVDTPGHGDAKGRDSDFRRAFVDEIRREKIVHAFIWVKNSASPRFDKEDAEFFRLFVEIFGKGIIDNLAIVLTRFSYSRDAVNRRKRSQTSLEIIIRGLRESISDPENNIPVIEIDALHDPENPEEVQKFAEGSERLWMIIQKFSKRPMEDVKFVEDSISNFNVKIEKLTDQINTLNAQNAEEKRMRNELEEKLNEVAENKEMLVKQLENQKTPSTKAKKSIVKKILSILILIEPIISAISTVFNSAKDLVR